MSLNSLPYMSCCGSGTGTSSPDSDLPDPSCDDLKSSGFTYVPVGIQIRGINI
jgi:hypothetical protein